jgi:hypothetical protein
VLYPEATPAQRSEREGARATGRKLAEIWWAAKLPPSTPFSLQHRCTVKRYRDERFILGIMLSASCLRDGDGKRKRRRRRKRQRLKKQRQGLAAAACVPLARRRHGDGTATARRRHGDGARRTARRRQRRRRRQRLTAHGNYTRLIFNPFGFRFGNKTTQKQRRNGEKTERNRPDFTLCPEAPEGAGQRQRQRKRHKRRTEHGARRRTARRTHAAHAGRQREAGRQPDGLQPDGSPSQRERKPDGSPMDGGSPTAGSGQQATATERENSARHGK